MQGHQLHHAEPLRVRHLETIRCKFGCQLRGQKPEEQKARLSVELAPTAASGLNLFRAAAGSQRRSSMWSMRTLVGWTAPCRRRGWMAHADSWFPAVVKWMENNGCLDGNRTWACWMNKLVFDWFIGRPILAADFCVFYVNWHRPIHHYLQTGSTGSSVLLETLQCTCRPCIAPPPLGECWKPACQHNGKF